MRFPPPQVVSSWPPPNFVDPVNRGPALIIVELTSLSVALVCLALRLYVRFVIIRKSWWDDWLMIGATIFAASITVCAIIATQCYGWNLHVWDLTLWQKKKGREISLAVQTLFLFASGLSKLSILTSYQRIAPLGSWFQRLTWVTTGIVFSLMWIFLVALWTQCSPAWQYWYISASGRNCVNEWPILAAQAITTVITAFIVYVLPMPTIFRLRLPTLQRVVLIALFSLGTAVVFAGIMRLYWVHYVETQTYDVTWEGFQTWIWTALEANLAIVCGCIPVLRRLLPSVSESKDLAVLNSTVPPTIGSGKKFPRRLDELDDDVEDHALDRANIASFADGFSMAMCPEVFSPGWSPTLDTLARQQQQRQQPQESNISERQF